LASQGSLITSAKYCRADSQSCNELRDRLYRSKDSYTIGQILGSIPAFPFAQRSVGVAVVKANGAHQNNQQDYNQQAGYHQQQTSYELPAEKQANQVNQLPPGWIALQDPGSGNTYYANQSTGETCWEIPASSTSASTIPQHDHTSYQNGQNSYDQDQQNVYDQSQNTPSNSTPAKLATKYGDGFVTSASHPELAVQYGNKTTSNPYSGATRPGTAAVTPTSTKPHVSEAFDPNNPPPVSAEAQHISDFLLATTTLLSTCVVSANEKRQYEEIKKSVGIFLSRLSRNEISQTVIEKVDTFVRAMQNKDSVTASSIQQSLVNSDWRQHKDWLKGFKFLFQLSHKKL